MFKAKRAYKAKLTALLCAAMLAGGSVFSASVVPVMAQQADTQPSPTSPQSTPQSGSEQTAPVAPAPANAAPSAPEATAPATTQPATTAPAADNQPSLDQPQAAPSGSAASPAASNDAQAPATQPEQAPASSQPVTLAPDAQNAQPQDGAPATERVAENGLKIPHDLSPWGMFMAADWVVKSVMIGLAIASLATWTVWLAKTIEIAGARSRARRALKEVSHAEHLAGAVQALEKTRGPGAHLVRAAQEEVLQSAPAVSYVGGDGLKERVSSRLSRIEAGAGRRLAKGTGILATIGSVAPFVGLFGTVWGIMNSFIGISEAQTTNLAVVAPGIAEALLATAIGLVAAIPAVIIYNLFARSVTAYRHLLADVGAGVERLVSRDLDMRTARDLAQKQAARQQVTQAGAAVAKAAE